MKKLNIVMVGLLSFGSLAMNAMDDTLMFDEPDATIIRNSDMRIVRIKDFEDRIDFAGGCLSSNNLIDGSEAMFKMSLTHLASNMLDDLKEFPSRAQVTILGDLDRDCRVAQSYNLTITGNVVPEKNKCNFTAYLKIAGRENADLARLRRDGEVASRELRSRHPYVKDVKITVHSFEEELARKILSSRGSK
ncbi:hypothetical protein KBC04_02750 [Candidatus Babeliales bacterium]|nr:hypothetical protein [Candidatus Babeliales bacterium]MBP9844028.1 hypothetical protein [Candidatus Babeliales bacterium]